MYHGINLAAFYIPATQLLKYCKYLPRRQGKKKKLNFNLLTDNTYCNLWPESFMVDCPNYWAVANWGTRGKAHIVIACHKAAA